MSKFMMTLACSALLLTIGGAASAQDGQGAVDSPAGPMQSDRLPGKCLDFTRIVDTISVSATMQPCTSRSHQQWYRGPASAPGYVTIANAQKNVCLGVSAADHHRVVAARCQRIPNQRWMLSPAKHAGRFILTNQLTGNGICLGIPEMTTHDSTGMSPCGGYPGQSWQVAG